MKFHSKPCRIHWCRVTWSEIKTKIQELKPSISKVVLLTDHITQKFCLPQIEDFPDEGVEIIQLDAGELCKTWDSLGNLLGKMLESGLDRASILLILGGGSLCDVGGLAAALYMRGIRVAYLPTTLLAMVDASIGGKLAVNIRHFKNMAGLFREPELIFCDSKFLNTLTDSQLKEGLIEMIKHAIIADTSHLDKLLSLSSHEEIKHRPDLIYESQLIKCNLVQKDPYDNGPRKLLNFGHTVGHALESYFNAKNKPLSHGHCVALGMMVALRLSEKMGLSKKDSESLIEFLKKLFPSKIEDMPDVQSLKSYLDRDKKNMGNNWNFVLIKHLGMGIWNIQVNHEEFEKAYNQVFFQYENHD